MSQTKYETFIFHYQFILSFPENAEVHMKLGEIYKSMDNFEMAKRHLNKAIELDGYFVIAFLNLAGLKTQVCFPFFFVPIMPTSLGH